MNRPQTSSPQPEKRDESLSRSDTPVQDRRQQLQWHALDNEHLWRYASGQGQPNYARINTSLPIAPNRRSPGALRLQYFKLRALLRRALKQAYLQNFAPDANEESARSLSQWMRPIFHIAISHRPNINQIDELNPMELFSELEDDDVMNRHDGDANVHGPLPLVQPLPDILEQEFAKFAPVNREHPWIKNGLPSLTRALQ